MLSLCTPSIRLFAGGKSFPHLKRFTHRISALFFPQVENPVERVQNSSAHACFSGWIPHFPRGFPHSHLDKLRTLHTFCNFQVRIMTNFWIEAAILLPFYPISFWRMQSSVENRSLLSLSRSSAQMLSSLVKMLHFTRFSIFRLRFRPRKLRFDYKNSLVDWFYPLFGVYLGCNFVKPYTKCCVGTKRPR